MQAQEEVAMIKGKRSKRARPASPLASTTAESSGGGSFGGAVISDVSGSSDRVTSINLSPSNSSGELTRGRDEEEEDMANCLILLAKGQSQKPSQAVAVAANKGAAAAAAEVYQCKTCNKSFPSFQALGGHRASHKKPIKPIALEEKKPLRDKQETFASTHDDDSTMLSLQIPCRISGSPQNKIKVHECSICGAEFASGQALGGHMRRHRPMPPAATTSGHGESQDAKRPRNLLSLDLNLPAPEEHDSRESKFPFAGPKEQVLVFSASPLVDCHY